jgi:hypothetical protein
MLTKSEIQFLLAMLRIFAKLKLGAIAPVQDVKHCDIIQKNRKNWVHDVTAVVIALHLANIVFCISRMRNSKTQTSVVLLFLIIESMVSIQFRITVVKCHTELAQLVSNLLTLHGTHGKTN